jgi:hypothetical protein
MRSLPSGKAVTNFSVATNEYRGGEERTEYHVKGKVSHLSWLLIQGWSWRASPCEVDAPIHHSELAASQHDR